ncbi:MAG: polysaccharide biosynthesis protein [Cyclobacteriaceae bacterium]|nr:MAG: polysaccharide biosynthesis protein [Cyclobacteriaceae bacterium]
MQKEVPKNGELNKQEKRNIATAAKGGSFGFIGKLYVQGISLFFVFLITRTFGAEQYGLYRLAILIATITAAISLIGLDGGVKRYVAIARSEHNKSKLWGVIQLGTLVPLAIGLFLSLVLCLSAEMVAEHIFHKPELAPMLRLSSMAVPFLVLVSSLSDIAIGFKKMEYNVYSKDLAFNGFKLLFSLVVILLGFQIQYVLVAFIAAAAFSTGVSIFFFNKLFPLRELPSKAERQNKEILRYSFPLFLSLLLNQFGRNFEALVLGAYGILADVGIYSVILTLSNIGNMGFVALRSISNPIFAELHHQKNFDELRRYYQTINRWSVSFNIPIFLLIVIFPDNILQVFGDEFSAGTTGLIILALGTLFNASTGACGALLNMSGYSKMNFYNSVVYLMTTLALDFLLIPKYGLVGAALAGSLTYVIINSLMMIEVYILIKKILPFNLSIYKPLLAGLLAGVSAYYTKSIILSDLPILQLILIGSTMLLVYGGVLKLLRFSEEDRFIFKKIFKKR